MAAWLQRWAEAPANWRCCRNRFVAWKTPRAYCSVKAELPRRQLLATVDGHVLLRICGPDIVGAWPDQTAVVQLLDDVCRPTADAENHEDGRKQNKVNAKGMVGRGRVEIHVGIQLLVRVHEFFNLLRILEPLRSSTRI